ncbi:MAG: prolyl oligopeptidase family serine peptidase [Acidobacteriia bacterium]|nr:prolyl oligopeptidase family serine peptidase [Terriglobia bacterium]
MIARTSMSHRDISTRFYRAALVLLLVLLPLTLLAQGGGQAAPPKTAPSSWADEILKQEGYVTPPPELVAAVTAPRHENVNLSNASPDKKWFLNEIGDGPVLMKTFSKPFDELGGVFIDFKANRARSLTVRNNVGIQLISATDGTRKQIQLPAGARVSNATWSPDSKSIAFFVHGESATHIWIADVATGQSRQLTKTPVLATRVMNFDFTEDGKQIATVLIPDGRAPRPVRPDVPVGPEIKITDNNRNRLRTFPSLMTTQYDFQLLEWHSTGQVALINVQTGAVKKIGKPEMVTSIDASPDGNYLRVTHMTKPFSYIVPVGNFGSVEEVWDTNGAMLTELNKRPLNLGAAPDDTTPPAPQAPGGARGGAEQTGRRELAWRPDGQGFTYLEQEAPPPGTAGAGGDRAAAVRALVGARGGTRGAGAGGGQQGPPRKDRLMQWLPPFDAKSAKMIFENNTRMSNHRFSPDMQILFFRETSGQNTLEVAVYLAEPTQRYTLAQFRTDDVNANPGSLVSARGGGGGGRGGGGGGGGRGGGGGAGGGTVLLSADHNSVFYEGTVNDKSPEQVGPKSFLDKVAIKTGEKARIYESDNKNVYERISTILDIDAGRFIIARESPTEVSQSYLVEGTSRKQLTQNKDLFPDLTSASRQRIQVERADGFHFRVTVMLPPGYKEGTRLPAIFWFYPREFDTQQNFDQPDRTFNKNTFQSYGTRSIQFFVRLGYAVVVDTPALPIVGQQGQQNNNYVNDLRNDLAAVIDELDRRAIIDRQRLAIGGHSYGAFTTVNAMVHTPFFKAGIAGDGAYNRTLTPLGFQNERRDLWEARDVYLGMSPFLYANNLTGALLMYHSLADQNVGTDPDNSIRLFHALNGMGKTAAMYLYPYEDHGPVAKETLLDQWARWAAWLDKYVKNPQPKETKKATDTPIQR